MRGRSGPWGVLATEGWFPAAFVGLTAVSIYGVAYLLGHAGGHVPGLPAEYDEIKYILLGRQPWLATAPYRPPLTWTLFHFLGYEGTIVFNLLCVGVCAAAVYAAGSRFCGWRLGVLCAVAILALPELWKWYPRLMPETPALAAVAVAVYALLAQRYWLAGISLGVAALGRPEMAGLALLVGSLGLWKPLRRYALVAVGCAIVIVPFTVRNVIASRSFVPLCSTGGLNLWIGNLGPTRLPIAWYGQRYPDIVEAVWTEGVTWAQRDAMYRQCFFMEAWRRPGDVMRLWGYKAVHFWVGRDFDGRNGTPGPALSILALLGFAGIAIGLRHKQYRGAAVMALVLISYVHLVSTLVFPLARTRLLIAPGLTLALALFVAHIGSIITRSPTSTSL